MGARRLVGGFTIVVLTLLAWLIIAPQQLGGPVAVVSTYGTSMLPTYSASDLVVVAKAREYQVGDVVAYRSEELGGAVILHRIVDTDQDGYVTQGDNNDFLDPDRPTDDELMGTARLRIPGAGRLLQVPTPVRAAAVAGLAGLAIFGGRQVRRRRTRRPVPATSSAKLLPYARRRRAAGHPRGQEAANGPRGFAWVGWPLTTALVAVTVAALALALTVAAFARPTTGPGELNYTHRGTFTYAADAASGAVYPSGEVATGDPIFLRLVDTLDLTLVYEFNGPGAAVEPTGRLWLELANGSGWSTRSPLSDQQTGDAGMLLLEGTLDIPRLRRTLEGVQEETGVAAGGGTITVTAEIEVTGAVAGEPVSDQFRPQIALQFEQARLVPQAAADVDGTGAAGSDGAAAAGTDDADTDDADTDDADTDRGIVESQDGSVAVPDAEPARLELLGRGIDVAAARIGAVALLVLALLALGVAAAGAARQHGLDEASRIRQRYGRRIIEVAALEVPAGYGIVDVRDVADLVGLADRVDRPVLHHRSAATDTYIVEGDATVYRYRVDATPRGATSGTRGDGHEPFTDATRDSTATEASDVVTPHPDE